MGNLCPDEVTRMEGEQICDVNNNSSVVCDNDFVYRGRVDPSCVWNLSGRHPQHGDSGRIMNTIVKLCDSKDNFNNFEESELTYRTLFEPECGGTLVIDQSSNSTCIATSIDDACHNTVFHSLCVNNKVLQHDMSQLNVLMPRCIYRPKILAANIGFNSSSMARTPTAVKSR